MNTRLIKVSKVIFDVLFWASLFGLVALIALAVALPSLTEVALDSAEPISTGFLGARIDIDLTGVRVDDATSVGHAALLALATGVAVYGFISHQIRRALRSVLNGGAFRLENYERMRRIAWAVLALIPIGIVSQSWVDSIVSGGFELSFDLQLGTVAAGLLAMSVAEIYKAGVSLQDESELTV